MSLIDKEDSPGMLELPALDPGSLPAGTRVLVIEDQPLVAIAARDMIESIGGTVAGTAATVEAALAECRAAAFDIALLDVDLGGVISAPVAAALAKAGKPFLIVSGTHELPPGFGASAHLAKPYTLRALRRGLAALLPR